MPSPSPSPPAIDLAQHLPAAPGAGAADARAKNKDGFTLAPFTVIIDSREQLPWCFSSLAPLTVPTIVAGLPAGDYSIAGHGGEIAVERKSKDDLHSTLTWGRERFERELAILNTYSFAAVIVEATWNDTLIIPPLSKVRRSSLRGSLIALPQRFPRVHWWFMDGRGEAERMCWEVLERWWRDRREEEKKVERERKKERRAEILAAGGGSSARAGKAVAE